jgi:hypothetical protein
MFRFFLFPFFFFKEKAVHENRSDALPTDIVDESGFSSVQ